MRKVKRIWTVRPNQIPNWGCSICGKNAAFIFEGELQFNDTRRIRDSIFRTNRCAEHAAKLALKHGLDLNV